MRRVLGLGALLASALAAWTGGGTHTEEVVRRVPAEVVFTR